MDLTIIKDIFGLEIAAFVLGCVVGYTYAIKRILPQRKAEWEKGLPTEIFSRSCELVECAYGGYKNEVKISVRGDKITNCACPFFSYGKNICRKTNEPCPIFNNGKL